MEEYSDPTDHVTAPMIEPLMIRKLFLILRSGRNYFTFMGQESFVTNTRRKLRGANGQIVTIYPISSCVSLR